MDDDPDAQHPPTGARARTPSPPVIRGFSDDSDAQRRASEAFRPISPARNLGQTPQGHPPHGVVGQGNVLNDAIQHAPLGLADDLELED